MCPLPSWTEGGTVKCGGVVTGGRGYCVTHHTLSLLLRGTSVG